MKTKIVVQGGYNDATDLKNILGNIHSSEFYFDDEEKARHKLFEVYESLPKKNDKFINYLPNSLMYGNAKACIIII